MSKRDDKQPQALSTKTIAQVIWFAHCSDKFDMKVAAQYENWLQLSRYANRGRIYLFAPMVEFNVMAEVGDTPP